MVREGFQRCVGVRDDGCGASASCLCGAELGAFDELGKGTAKFGESGEAVERGGEFSKTKKC